MWFRLARFTDDYTVFHWPGAPMYVVTVGPSTTYSRIPQYPRCRA